jgi:hypothetical protein
MYLVEVRAGRRGYMVRVVVKVAEVALPKRTWCMMKRTEVVQ